MKKGSRSLTTLSDSTRTWSYSLRATRNMMEVTFSKQWIHFLRSERCPPTSTILGRPGASGTRELRPKLTKNRLPLKTRKTF